LKAVSAQANIAAYEIRDLCQARFMKFKAYWERRCRQECRAAAAGPREFVPYFGMPIKQSALRQPTCGDQARTARDD
jgi:hypothetical protein